MKTPPSAEPTSSTNQPEPLKLGLIGAHIAASQAPDLHRLAGRMVGRPVTYDRLVPDQMGLSFEAVVEKCAAEGYRGVNVTYPYKQRVVALLGRADDDVRRVGAANTVLFEPAGLSGSNTDHTGFMTAYRRKFGNVLPSSICMVGAGGVGRAVGFGLCALGATKLVLVEKDLSAAHALAAELKSCCPALDLSVTGDVAAGATGVAGLVNCSPVGMVGIGGTPVPASVMVGAEWAFDAVYMPIDTQFLQDATKQGLRTLSGYELFFYQGLHAMQIFHGRPFDEVQLRTEMT